MPSARAFQSFSWVNYQKIFNTDLIGVVVRNTLVMTAAAATLTVVLSFLISVIVVRSTAGVGQATAVALRPLTLRGAVEGYLALVGPADDFVDFQPNQHPVVLLKHRFDAASGAWQATARGRCDSDRSERFAAGRRCTLSATDMTAVTPTTIRPTQLGP